MTSHNKQSKHATIANMGLSKYCEQKL